MPQGIMNKFKLQIKYKVDEQVISSDLYENQDYAISQESSDNRLTLKIIPKKELEFIDFKIEYQYNFERGDRFFINGYQSWTTSKEVSFADKMKRYNRIADMSKKTQELARTSGDAYIIDYPKKAGIFHSFTYTYIRNEEDVVLWGSANERTGYTIFRAFMNDNKFEIIKDLEGVITSSEYELLDIVKYNGTYDDVFDKYFNFLAFPAPKLKFLSGYTSWYNYFQNISEEIILRDLEGTERVKEKIKIFQIDDGYAPAVGDWLDYNEKFPNGMKSIADKIHEKGYLAGIWLAPFNAQIKSKIVETHPEWFLKHPNGKFQIGCVGWGGAYILNLDLEEVRAHIKNFFDVILNDWGYDMVKLDFLYSQCIFPRGGKSRGQIMCEAMDFLRECVGDKLLLGCGVPLGPAFGRVDACRISCDVDLSFKNKYYAKLNVNNEIISTKNAMTNTIFRRHLDGRIFCNDPDVMFFRNNNLKFTWDQKMMLSTVNNMFGNVLFVSDNIGDYDEKAIEAIKNAFTKKEVEVIMVEYVDDDFVRVKVKDGEYTKNLSFDLNTGEMTL
ncbi:MAG: alpha-galactosidase [Clostridiales bacterium]|jgi:alpha-galactosidase|nr:alpha-galactosidase [Clostridiales bacterium]